MNAVHEPHAGIVAALLDPARAPAALRVPSGVDAARRFDVHRNNVVSTLVDALAEAFPVVRTLVGDAFFAAMARERVRRDPPRSPILSDYGAGFAAFVAGHAPAAELPYLADLARLEHLRSVAYHAADADPLAPARYDALRLAPERLAAARLRLHPACRWLSSRYAVRSLWEAHQGDAAARDAALAALDLDAGEDTLLTRPRWQVHTVALPPGGVAWLDALRAGRPIGEAMAHAVAQADTPPEALFALLIRHGLAVAIDLPEES